MIEPKNPPQPEKKWRRLNELLQPHKDVIERAVEANKQSLIENGFRTHNLKGLVALGYALALEERGLNDW